MPFKFIINTAFRALNAQKTRSALTILGIVIGVAAIIMVMSLGKGAEALILGEVSGLGEETVVLRPGSGLADITQTLFSRTLTNEDIEAIKKKQNVPNLLDIAPLVIAYEVVEFKGETYRPSIMGGSAELMADIMDLTVQEGRLYSSDEIDQELKVAVIGAEVREELFGYSQSVGKQIKIKDKKFRVVGVLDEAGTMGPMDIDAMVMIPYTTAQTYITGTNYFSEVLLTADSPENVDKLAYDVTVTLRDTHDIGFGEDDDFNVKTQEETIETIETVINIFTSFLIAVVAISLVVGGVGIMNIMLVSVSERTKEIGLRKALGATRKDILEQFLSEAIILTSVGGVVGVFVGASLSYLISIILVRTAAEDWVFIFPIAGALLGVSVSAIVGLMFGIYPANKASKKSPIEALRYE